MTWLELVLEVRAASSAVDVWHRLVPPKLLEVPGETAPLAQAAHDVADWHRQGLDLLTVLDEEYPSQLLGVHQPPPVLFSRGHLIPADQAVAVVGSRNASEHGLSLAEGVARGLTREGITVAAGLALGIDTAAHRAALDAGGRTVGVIGTGINRVYPAANRMLHEEIATHGLLLSQFWPDAPPQRHAFLMRNATMSAYSMATVVIEAGEKSGSRAGARMAVEHSRPVVLTELVVERNDWAEELLGRPGVHVATAAREVVEIICDLTAS